MASVTAASAGVTYQSTPDLPPVTAQEKAPAHRPWTPSSSGNSKKPSWIIDPKNDTAEEKKHKNFLMWFETSLVPAMKAMLDKATEALKKAMKGDS